MKISVEGKNLDVGDALRSHIEENLIAGVEKYFNNAVDGSVTVSKANGQFKTDISVHVGRDILVQGRNANDDPYAAFEGALERIGKQLRRYKRRLRDHHRSKERAEAALVAQKYILAPEPEHDDNEPDHGDPTIIAEMATKIDTLTVGEAVMRLDLADLPTMMFRNSAHGGLNVVYRRTDGNIGWIDPSLVEKSA